MAERFFRLRSTFRSPPTRLRLRELCNFGRKKASYAHRCGYSLATVVVLMASDVVLAMGIVGALLEHGGICGLTTFGSIMEPLRSLRTRARHASLSAANRTSSRHEYFAGTSIIKSPGFRCRCMCCSALYTMRSGHIRKMCPTHFRRRARIHRRTSSKGARLRAGFLVH